MAQALPIDPRILEEAAEWLVRLHASDASEADRDACADWRTRSTEHARAWARAELLMNKLGGLPASLAMPALDRPRNASRRATIGKLAVLLAAVPAGLAAWRVAEQNAWTADHRSATGERRALQLADGSRVTLNTASAIDVRFDAQVRHLQLRSGEVLIETAADTATTHRPFRVGSAHGVMEALGTRFSVRQEAGHTELIVLEGAVRIRPHTAASATRVLHAGEQTRFDTTAIATPQPVDDARTAWVQGMLLADRMRLADFVQELARYRPGILRVDPAVAHLRVSGAYPVTDTEHALAMLVSTYPLVAATRLRGYWVTLLPAAG